jgi:hypothetical protein
MSTYFRIYLKQRGMHTRLHFYAGVEGSRSSIGELVLRFPESDRFLAAIQSGSVGPEGSGAEVEVLVEPRRDEPWGSP